MSDILQYCNSSIGKKQIVASTGLLLILFVAGHLAGNLFIFLGPEAFNAYAKKLANLRPGLYVIEFGLLALFIIHMYVTALLIWENIQSRPVGYQVFKSSQQRSLATRLMPYTGTILLAFVIWHLLDFTFVDKHGPRSILADGQSYGLYGIVYNSFSDPIHCFLYIIAMIALGLHLSHGVQSFCQTFGFNHPRYTPVIKIISDGFAIMVTVGYSLIPLCILLKVV